jgi:ketosteroid isomerase-like protein
MMAMRTELKIPAAALGTVLLAVLAGCTAGAGSRPTGAAPVVTDPRAVAETFNRALAAGDGDAVRSLLVPGVLIFESGGAETSALEYAGHHLPADMAFMASVKREQISQASGGDDSNAWVATRSRLSGSFKGKDLDLDSTETLVMSKTDAGWRIVHVHWSSAPHRNAKP